MAIRLELEKPYQVHLTINNIVHYEANFRVYLNRVDNDVCPSGGEILYDDREVV